MATVSASCFRLAALIDSVDELVAARHWFTVKVWTQVTQASEHTAVMARINPVLTAKCLSSMVQIFNSNTSFVVGTRWTKAKCKIASVNSSN